MDIAINPASEANIVGIVYVQATSWIENFQNKEQGIDEGDVRSINFQDKLAQWRHALLSPDYKVWVASEGENIVAFLATRQGESDLVEISEQHTLPKYQRQGLGSQLLTQALANLNSPSGITLRIPIYATSGVNFYKKHGFKVYEAGEVDFIRLPSGKQITTIEMRKIPVAEEEKVESKQSKQKLNKQPYATPRAKPLPRPSNQSQRPQKPSPTGLVGRSQLAELSGIRASTIKYYTEIGILPFVQKDTRLARRYLKSEALKRIEEIKKLRSQELSIAEIKQRLTG